MDYKQKYFKYKEKYLEIKKLNGLIGGSSASSINCLKFSTSPIDNYNNILDLNDTVSFLYASDIEPELILDKGDLILLPENKYESKIKSGSITYYQHRNVWNRKHLTDGEYSIKIRDLINNTDIMWTNMSSEKTDQYGLTIKLTEQEKNESRKKITCNPKIYFHIKEYIEISTTPYPTIKIGLEVSFIMAERLNNKIKNKKYVENTQTNRDSIIKGRFIKLPEPLEKSTGYGYSTKDFAQSYEIQTDTGSIVWVIGLYDQPILYFVVGKVPETKIKCPNISSSAGSAGSGGSASSGGSAKDETP